LVSLSFVETFVSLSHYRTQQIQKRSYNG